MERIEKTTKPGPGSPVGRFLSELATLSVDGHRVVVARCYPALRVVCCTPNSVSDRSGVDHWRFRMAHDPPTTRPTMRLASPMKTLCLRQLLLADGLHKRWNVSRCRGEVPFGAEGRVLYAQLCKRSLWR